MKKIEPKQQDRAYDEAMERFFAPLPGPLRRPGQRLPTRDELYDRPGLRRLWKSRGQEDVDSQKIEDTDQGDKGSR